MSDQINPQYYRHQEREVWELMLDAYGLDAFINFARLNAFKYRMRAGYKGFVEEDIKKAMWYEDKIKELKE